MKILEGCCIEKMKEMEAKSVNTCVTSPPYFGLRDYGTEGQIGLEDTPDAFVARLVEVFREVKRVLRDDGTLWLNLGDSYAGSGPSGASYRSKSTIKRESMKRDGAFAISKTLVSRRLSYAQKKPIPPKGLKHKDLIGIPWRVAFALQADGWYLRQDIIWHKPNPMPESVKDRCTKAHEYIFLLSKKPKYYFDSEAMKEPATCGRLRGSGPMVNPGTGRNDTTQKGDYRVRPSKKKGEFNGKTEAMASTGQNAFRAVTDTRNKRSVWTVTTKPFKGAHFAVFPPDLIEPCVLAGCPEGGTVLDPFTGSGTTGIVAARNRRNFIGCELNPEYAEMARGRIRDELLNGFIV